MKRKLASCSTRGRLTFDTCLLEEAEAKRLDAVLHELLHLRYPNDGKMFKALLRAYMGMLHGGKLNETRIDQN